MYGSDVSAAESAAHQQAWISRADENRVGPRHTVAPAEKRPQASHRPYSFQTPEPVTNERYPRHARLTRGSELTTCWEAGRRRRTPHLDLAWRHNVSGHARTGIIVPLYQSSAARRNRLRRRIKEILRRELQRKLPAIDLVVRAKRSAYAASFADLRAELTGVVETLT
jgi:ribonuclease P protein component